MLCDEIERGDIRAENGLDRSVINKIIENQYTKRYLTYWENG